MGINFDEVDKYGSSEFISDSKKCVETFVWMWNYLRLSLVGAKFHLVKDHLVQQLECWKAIGPFNEEFMEADHVVGNCEYRYFASLRNDDKKAIAISKREAMSSNPDVAKVIEKVSGSSKSKRRRLTCHKRQLIEDRREEVHQEVNALKSMYGDTQIHDYWNYLLNF